MTTFLDIFIPFCACAIFRSACGEPTLLPWKREWVQFALCSWGEQMCCHCNWLATAYPMHCGYTYYTFDSFAWLAQCILGMSIIHLIRLHDALIKTSVHDQWNSYNDSGLWNSYNDSKLISTDPPKKKNIIWTRRMLFSVWRGSLLL